MNEFTRVNSYLPPIASSDFFMQNAPIITHDARSDPTYLSAGCIENNSCTRHSEIKTLFINATFTESKATYCVPHYEFLCFFAFYTRLFFLTIFLRFRISELLTSLSTCSSPRSLHHWPPLYPPPYHRRWCLSLQVSKRPLCLCLHKLSLRLVN